MKRESGWGSATQDKVGGAQQVERVGGAQEHGSWDVRREESTHCGSERSQKLQM